MEQTFDRAFVLKRVTPFNQEYGVHQLGVTKEHGPVECFLCNNGDIELIVIDGEMLGCFAPEDIIWTLPPFILTEKFGKRIGENSE